MLGIKSKLKLFVMIAVFLLAAIVFGSVSLMPIPEEESDPMGELIVILEGVLDNVDNQTAQLRHAKNGIELEVTKER